jgi:Circularly permutated YpsA SLOG family
MIKLVISGGQTGVDQAAWRAATRLGIKTDGYMPKDYLTEDGHRPDFRRHFGAREHRSPMYPPRTFANVALADATLIVAPSGDSRGTDLTISACARLDKPYRVVRPLQAEPDDFELVQLLDRPGAIARWLRRNVERRPIALNVAGSRESKNPGIGAWAEGYLHEVFRLANSSGD